MESDDTSGESRRAVHRLRDLDRRSRWVALAVGLGLVLAPLLAAVMFHGRWAPTGDKGLMALRGLDVGTSRTPLIGQPSSSHLYAAGDTPAHHPGALHFYLMAVPMRVLGGSAGLLAVSVAITGTALVTSAWAVFRQLGRAAGMLAAVLLAAIAFTTGAGSLVNPVSSNIAGYPLLLSAVLLWCVACGDARLLPLTAAAVSFTVQQHLSVSIATTVLAVGGLALLGVTAWREHRRDDPSARRDLWRGAVGAGAVSLVLWAPVLGQQLFGDVSNLGQIVSFAREGNADTLGFASALSQLGEVLGVPPLLGRTDVTGLMLLERPSTWQWLTAGLVVAAVAGLGWWWRVTRPRQAMLCAMAGVLMVAGLLNGASVPRGFEQTRLAFYHWVWPLLLFVGLILGLAAWQAIRRVVVPGPAVRAALTVAAVAAVAAPAVVGPLLERDANTLFAAGGDLDRDVIDELVDEVLAHRDEIGDHVVFLPRNEPLLTGTTPGLQFRLIERGLDVRFPRTSTGFVSSGRLVDAEALDGALVAQYVGENDPAPPEGGTLVAEHRFEPTIDEEAHAALVAALRDVDEVRLADDDWRRLADRYTAPGREILEDRLVGIARMPDNELRNTDVVQFLIDHPPVDPELDPDELARLRASLDRDDLSSGIRAIRIYLLDREEALDEATSFELLGVDDADV